MLKIVLTTLSSSCGTLANVNIMKHKHQHFIFLQSIHTKQWLATTFAFVNIVMWSVFTLASTCIFSPLLLFCAYIYVFNAFQFYGFRGLCACVVTICFLSSFVYILLAPPIMKKLHICARFGLGDKILAHSLANVKLTSVHRMKIFTWM
jgi:hypothetical protein